MEQVLDVPAQEVITRANAMVTVDGVVFFQILHPAKAAYEVSGLDNAIRNLTMTNLRTVMGSMDLADLLSSCDQINAKLLHVVDEATTPRGVKVTRIEIKDSRPPQNLVGAMARQMKAEREKWAAIPKVEGRNVIFMRRSLASQRSLTRVGSAGSDPRTSAVARAVGGVKRSFRPLSDRGILPALRRCRPACRRAVAAGGKAVVLHVFVSYASEDFDIARRLHADLQRPGIDPWMDDELRPGGQWNDDIVRQITGCDCFLALISGRSLDEDRYVPREWQQALAEGKYFVPVRLEDFRLADVLPKEVSAAVASKQ